MGDREWRGRLLGHPRITYVAVATIAGLLLTALGGQIGGRAILREIGVAMTDYPDSDQINGQAFRCTVAETLDRKAATRAGMHFLE